MRQCVLNGTTTGPARDAVETALEMLDAGEARVAEKVDGAWRVNEWLKKAVLLSFRLVESEVIEGQWTRYYDKVSTKYVGTDDAEFKAGGVRVDICDPCRLLWFDPAEFDSLPKRPLPPTVEERTLPPELVTKRPTIFAVPRCSSPS